MQRLALACGGRHVLHKSPVRLFTVPSNPESSFNALKSESPLIPVGSLEQSQGTVNRAEISSRRRAPRADTLGDVSIPLPHLQMIPNLAPRKDSQADLTFARRLATRQLAKAPSVQPSGQNSDTVTPEASASPQNAVEGRKHVQGKAAVVERTASRLLANERMNARNDNQRDRQRPGSTSGNSYHSRDSRGVNTNHASQPRRNNQGANQRAGGRTSGGRTSGSRRDSMQTQNPLSDASSPTPKQPSSSKKRDDNQVLVRSPGFSDKPNISETDLHTLFGGDTNTHSTSSLSNRPSEETLAFLRTQVMLEEAGGDYSRFLPPKLMGMGRRVGPVRYAHLTLARRRDVGLRATGNVVRIVKASVGGKA